MNINITFYIYYINVQYFILHTLIHIIYKYICTFYIICTYAWNHMHIFGNFFYIELFVVIYKYVQKSTQNTNA